MVQAVHRLITETYPKIEEMYGESINIRRLEWEGLKEEISQLEHEQIEAVQKHLEAAKAEQSWSLWNQGFQYVGSSVSIWLGMQFMAVPGGYDVGATMVAGGITGLAHRGISDLGGWKVLSALITQSREQQRRIENGIDFAASGAFLALTLGPGLFTRALLQPQMFESTANVAQKAVSIFAALTRVGQAKAQVRTAEKREGLEICQTHQSLLRQNQIEAAQKLNNDFQPAIERAIRNLAANNNH